MRRLDDSRILQRLKKELRSVVIDTLNNYNRQDKNLEAVMLLQVKLRMSTYVNTSIFHSDAVHFTEYEVRDSFCQVDCSNSTLLGTVTLVCQEKKDTLKFGGPGFKGNENGEVCQYPDYRSTYYQWDALRCRWKDVGQQVCNPSIKEPGFFDKLLNNAAFEPMWGNNRTGEDIFGNSGRKANGQNTWGSPQMRKPMGTFKQISGDVFKSVYRFTLDLKSAISHYLKIEEVLKDTKTDTIIRAKSKVLIDSLSKADNSLVKIRINKIRDWTYFNNNGSVNATGIEVQKDTSVYPQDVDKVMREIENSNRIKKERAFEDFKNKK